jgi:hypothetical protein
MKMKEKFREFLNGIGMILAAVGMMVVAIAFIFLIHAAFHTGSK